jgi:archaetidylinositol phosphate synthase
MVLEGYRERLDLFFDPLARLFIRVDPDIISSFSFLFAIAGGVTLALSGIWLPGGRWDIAILGGLIFIGLNSIADTLDGRVARMAGTSSKVGDFLDHTFDRLSDIVLLAGIAISPYCHTTFGLISVTAVLLSSYMGTQAQAVGAGRDYSGVMGRADRMVLMMFVLPFQFVLVGFYDTRGIELGLGREIIPLEVLMGIMLIGGLLTTFTRGFSTFASLKEKEVNDGESKRPQIRKPPVGGRRT